MEASSSPSANNKAKRLRVLLITTSFPPMVGGIATWAATLAETLSRAGHEVTVLTLASNDRAPAIADARVVRLPAQFGKRFIKIAPLTLLGLVLCVQSRPNRLILMTWKHEGITGYLLKRILGIEYIVIAHGSEILENTRWRLRSRVMRSVFFGATRVVVNSGYTRQLLLGLGVAPENIAVIHPAAQIDPIAGSLSLQEVERLYDLTGRRVVLTVGRLVRRKGHEEVIRAVAQLGERYPNLVYVIAGEGERRRHLEELVKMCGVQERVLILGRVPALALDGLYRLCEVFVLPARQDGTDVEGFGIGFLEAAARARPVIAGNSGGVTEAVVDGETGLLVEPGNTADVAHKLIQLLDNPDLRRRLGEGGLRRAHEQFSQAAQLSRILSALEGEGRRATTDEAIGGEKSTKSSPLV